MAFKRRCATHSFASSPWAQAHGYRHTVAPRPGHLPTVGNPSDVRLNTSPPSAAGPFSRGNPAAGRREPRQTANARSPTVGRTSPSWPPAEPAPASWTARVAAPLSEPLELTDAPRKRRSTLCITHNLVSNSGPSQRDRVRQAKGARLASPARIELPWVGWGNRFQLQRSCAGCAGLRTQPRWG